MAVELREPDAAAGERVEVRGGDLTTVWADVGPAHVVHEHDDDVRPGIGSGRGRGAHGVERDDDDDSDRRDERRTPAPSRAPGRHGDLRPSSYPSPSYRTLLPSTAILCAMTLPGRRLLGSLRLVSVTSLAVLLAGGLRRHGGIRRRLGCRRAAGRYRSRRGDDRRAHLRTLPRGDQPLGRRRPLRGAGPGPGLRRQGLRGLLDALRRKRRGHPGGHEVRAGRAQRAPRRAERRGRNTPGPPLRRSGAEVRRLAMAPSRAGHAGLEPAHRERDRT